MNRSLIKKIKDNPNLVAFCNKILTLNAIFENEPSRYMFLVSLISADSLTDIHACEESIETSNFILNHIDLFVLDNKVKDEIIEYANKAIEIANNDLQEFNKDKK